jgi:hypothetical protein
MTISDEVQNSLLFFREGIIRRDWIQRKEQMIDLLTHLGAEKSLSLAIAYVEKYLPIFKQLNPNEDWPENRLNEMKREIAHKPVHTSLPPYPEVSRKHIDSVSRTFNGGAMYNLWCAARQFRDETKCIEYTGEALSFLLTFIYADAQHRVAPQLNQYEKDPFNPERVQLIFRIRNQPELAHLEQEIWLNLATDIENRLLHTT